LTILVTKKTLKAYAKLMGIIIKKDVSVMLKARKALIKVGIAQKTPTKRIIKVSIKEVIVSGVIGARIANRTIRLPQRFK
jgi:hypothetical protein